MTRVLLAPQFIGSAGQRIFTLSWLPEAGRKDYVLLVPPFGEEMNKTRRMLAITAQQLVTAGIGARSVDFFGTGDSDGEFAEATWSRWKQDLIMSVDAFARQGASLRAVLAVRTACALVSEVAHEAQWQLERTVFWQPVLDGSKFLTQLLRLRIAASVMGDDRRETTSELRARLQAGETLEVAGYDLSPELARELDGLKAAPTSDLGMLHWFEISSSGELNGAAEAAVRGARERGLSVKAHGVPGEPFWNATEIVTNRALIDRTVAVLAGHA